jgi:hypothetical protein
MKQQGCSVRAMGRKLNCPASTISRELVRNTGAGQTYGSHVAQQTCQARRRAAKPACKLALDSVTWGPCLPCWTGNGHLSRSPLCSNASIPNESMRRVSHDTIDTATYAVGLRCQDSRFHEFRQRVCLPFPASLTGATRSLICSASKCAHLSSKYK